MLVIRPRSLPGGISSTATTPPTAAGVETSNMSTTTTNGSSLITFSKTILLPIMIALILYLLLFHALLPFYRHHRARYAQYLPLNSIPESLQPSSLRSRVSSVFLRIFLPSTWAFRHRHTQSRNARRPSIPSTISEEDLVDHDNASDRFSDDHGEAMVGFALYPSNTRTPTHNQSQNQTQTRTQDQNRRRRRDGMDRQVSRNIQAAREMNAGVFDEPPPERRLSRELEEVFRDDSDDDEEDEGRGVTVGRRSLSFSRR